MLWTTFVQLWERPELKIFAKSEVVYPGVISSRFPKMGWIEPWTKTVVVFASGKCRWIGCSYNRLCENFWWLTIVSREQFRSDFGPKNFFLLNFTRLLSFFWDLGVSVFHILNIIFAEILVVSNIFVFSDGKLAPKWTKTVNFACPAFEAKHKISMDFSNTVFVLLETIYQSLYPKFQQHRSIFGGVRPETQVTAVQIARIWKWNQHILRKVTSN